MKITICAFYSRDRYEYLWRTFTDRGSKLPYRGEVWRAK